MRVIYIYTFTYPLTETRDSLFSPSFIRSFDRGAITDTRALMHTLPSRKESIRLQERARVVRLAERSKSSLSHLLLPRNCQSIERADLKWLRFPRKLVVSTTFAPAYPSRILEEINAMSVSPANIYIFC